MSRHFSNSATYIGPGIQRQLTYAMYAVNFRIAEVHKFGANSKCNCLMAVGNGDAATVHVYLHSLHTRQMPDIFTDGVCASIALQVFYDNVCFNDWGIWVRGRSSRADP